MPSKSPDAFRTISEVADWLQTPAHVLRFWESKFSQVKPVKRAGGRRYYRPADMALIGGIKKLLHDDGMTIKGVQKILREQGIKHVAALSPPLDEDLEGMIDAAVPAAPATTPAPETGKVLDFANRPTDDTTAEDPSAEDTGAKSPRPAPVSPVAKDLFDEDNEDEKIFASQAEAPTPVVEDAPAAEAEAPADAPEPDVAASHDDLPDFVQKPMSERLAEDEVEAAATADEDAHAAEEPPAEAEDVPAETEETTGEAEPAPEPQSIAADTATPDDGDTPAATSDDIPVDPLDHDLAAPSGPLTYLTSAEMRAKRHSAEQIETLIIRVRNHHRALTHAARH